MKFSKEEYINSKGQTCVVGALALSQGISKNFLRNTGESEINTRVANKLKLSVHTVEGLINLNDQGRWTRLLARLKTLELVHLVKKYALPETTRTTKTTKTKVNA